MPVENLTTKETWNRHGHLLNGIGLQWKKSNKNFEVDEFNNKIVLVRKILE